jgi:hypothetical protein
LVRCLEVHGGGEGLDVHLDPLGRVFGGLRGSGDHRGHRLADVADPIDREYGLDVGVEFGLVPDADRDVGHGLQVAGGENGAYPRHPRGWTPVDAPEQTMRDRAPHHPQPLAAFKCPKQVHVVPALPRNALGKVVRGELPALHSAPEDRG